MFSKIKLVVAFIIILSICQPALAQQGIEVASDQNNQESPLQVIVEITLSAIVLRILNVFKLP